jgi:hypothetical protein
MADYLNPGQNNYDGPSSLTPGETTAPAAITRNHDATLAHVKRNGSAMADRPDAQPFAPAFGMRDRAADASIKVPKSTHRK